MTSTYKHKNLHITAASPPGVSFLCLVQ
ncbi:hypothetical protein CEXT_37451, partial [Caerostris extrusa]